MSHVGNTTRFSLANVAIILNLCGVVSTGYFSVGLSPVAWGGYGVLTLAILWVRYRRRIAMRVHITAAGVLVLSLVCAIAALDSSVLLNLLFLVPGFPLLFVWPFSPYLVLILSVQASRQGILQSLVAIAGAIATMAFTVPIYVDLFIVNIDPQNAIALLTVPFFPLVGALALSFMHLADMARYSLGVMAWAFVPPEDRRERREAYFGRAGVDG
jgi:hypothetical protein